MQVANDQKLREEMRKKLEKELDEEYCEKIEFLKVRSPEKSRSPASLEQWGDGRSHTDGCKRYARADGNGFRQ